MMSQYGYHGDGDVTIGGNMTVMCSYIWLYGADRWWQQQLAQARTHTQELRSPEYPRVSVCTPEYPQTSVGLRHFPNETRFPAFFHRAGVPCVYLLCNPYISNFDGGKYWVICDEIGSHECKLVCPSTSMHLPNQL